MRVFFKLAFVSPREGNEAVLLHWLKPELGFVRAGEEVVECIDPDGLFLLRSPATGILAEVFVAEGMRVGEGDILAAIDEGSRM